MSDEKTICRFVLTIEQSDALNVAATSVAVHRDSNPAAARAALFLKEAMGHSRSKGMPVVGLAMPLFDAQAFTVLLSAVQADSEEFIKAKAYWALEVLYAQRRASGDDQKGSRQHLKSAA